VVGFLLRGHSNLPARNLAEQVNGRGSEPIGMQRDNHHRGGETTDAWEEILSGAFLKLGLGEHLTASQNPDLETESCGTRIVAIHFDSALRPTEKRQ
jgi:hypothetical protein